MASLSQRVPAMDADAVYKEPSPKISRTRHVEDQPSNSMQRNSNELICDKCDNKIPDFTEELHCKECRFNFCKKCSSRHKKAIKHIYSEPFQTVCKEHDIELTCFCKEEKCNLQICRRCASEKHKGHNILQMNAKSKQCLDHFSNIKDANIEKLKRTKEVLERLNTKKVDFEKNVSEMHSVLQERRDGVIKIVDDVFQEQSKRLLSIQVDVVTEFDNKIQELKTIVSELKNVVQLDFHFPLYASKEKVIQCYQSRLPFYKYEIIDYLVELKKIAVSPAKKATEFFHKNLKSMIGKIDLFINGSLFRGNEAYVTSVIHKTTSEEVQDICYDPKHKNLFATTLYQMDYYVYKFSEGKFEHSSKLSTIEVTDMQSFLYIALLPNRCILLLNKGTLSMLSKGMRYLKLPSSLSNLRVSTICSSSCLTQTFLYVHDLCGIMMYKSNTDLACKRIGLPFVPLSMKVHGNLDYIAFIGGKLENIVLCSFKQGTTLCCSVRDFSCKYYCGCFLSENLFIAYDGRNYELDMFKLENLERPTVIYTHSISNVRCEGRDDIRYIRTIAKKSPSSVYVCAFIDSQHLVYEAIF